MNNHVTIYCKNNATYKTYPVGISLLEIYEDLNVQLKYQVVAARVNKKMEDLHFFVYKPKDIEFIDISTPAGMRTYVRTLSMVLAKAIDDLFPNATFRLAHPISKGYYCTISHSEKSFSPDDIYSIRKRMQELISLDLPIVKQEKQTKEVILLFRERGQMDKVLLLETLSRPYANYFELDGYPDFYNGPLLPGTGYLKIFDLLPFYDGMLLRVPNRENPSVLEEMIPQPQMFEIFKEYIEWNRIMGLSNVGDFNLACRERRTYNLIKISEALHEKKIAAIADQIYNLRETAHFVMISGPSSSGKTTFSKRLSVQLMVNGLNPINISLDNYFLNREQTPLDKNGEYDFESLFALDLEFLNQQLQDLLDGKEIETPSFSFEHGKRIFRGDKIKLSDKDILIIEGIHALNPNLTTAIPEKTKFKIYVSALTTISLDDHNWIPTTDTRLLRRIIRDYRYRSYSAQETISRWDSVRSGEDKWIFPYQENADVMFNSALIFELSVLKKHAQPILEEVPRDCDEYSEAHRLLKFLDYFSPIYEREIPPTSLLREFLGGSSFRY